MSIVIAILVFGIIVLIHEFGHYAMARKCGILVEEFAIGMGPLLWSVKRGDTMYSIRALPIGGFCKMLGEDEDSNDERAFNSKSVLERMGVLSAGAVMNFLLAFAVFALIVFLAGFGMPVVGTVVEGTPAEAAGLMPGDRIVRVNNDVIHIYEDLSFALNESGGKPMDVTIARGGERIKMTIVPYVYKEKEDDQEQYKMGFNTEAKAGWAVKNERGLPKVNLLDCITTGFFQIAFFIRVTVLSLIRLVTMKLSVNDMSGMIGIVSVIGETYKATAKAGFLSVFVNVGGFVGMLSANLGVFNLLPLPALDGGRLVFVLFEGIRKKPVDPEKEGFVHFVGFVLLMALAAFIAINDIRKII